MAGEEESAYAIATAKDRDEQVTKLVRDISKSSSKTKLELCTIAAWLLNYGVIEPKLILQILVLTRAYSILEVCGTKQIDKSWLSKLNLEECEPQPLKYDRSACQPVKTDFKTATKRASDTSTHNSKRLATKSSTNVGTSLIKSSLSPPETAFRLSKLPPDDVAQSLVNECRVFEHFFVQTATLLIDSRPQLKESFTSAVELRIKECDELEVEELQAFGTLIAHFLSRKICNTEILALFELNSKNEFVSQRILLMALVTELRLEMGAKEAEMVIASNSNLLKSTISPYFFQLAGYTSLAKQLKNTVHTT